MALTGRSAYRPPGTPPLESVDRRKLPARGVDAAGESVVTAPRVRVRAAVMLLRDSGAGGAGLEAGQVELPVAPEGEGEGVEGSAEAMRVRAGDPREKPAARYDATSPSSKDTEPRPQALTVRTTDTAEAGSGPPLGEAAAAAGASAAASTAATSASVEFTGKLTGSCLAGEPQEAVSWRPTDASDSRAVPAAVAADAVTV